MWDRVWDRVGWGGGGHGAWGRGGGVGGGWCWGVGGGGGGGGVWRMVWHQVMRACGSVHVATCVFVACGGGGMQSGSVDGCVGRGRWGRWDMIWGGKVKGAWG